MSIAFKARAAVVAPVDKSNSMRELPLTVLPAVVSTMSKFPNKSVTGNVSSDWISKVALGSSITFAKMSVPVVLAGQ